MLHKDLNDFFGANFDIFWTFRIVDFLIVCFLRFEQIHIYFIHVLMIFVTYWDVRSFFH